MVQNMKEKYRIEKRKNEVNVRERVTTKSGRNRGREISIVCLSKLQEVN
jgi:hypothetical protein